MTPGLGLVSLVGAGPGDPDFLTVKAARRLQEADIVFHDALVSAEVLAIAARAECVDVGKRGGRDSTPQAAIETALISAARLGRRVVRLKGGDPFVFGRGGEEGLALQAAGVPFEIVPGISTAIAAPALAGIPVTHRGVASGVLVINGADPIECARQLAAVSPSQITLVIMMATRVRAAAVDALIGRGWDADTPAALIVGASWPQEWVWRGPLFELASVEIPSPSRDLPGTLVIGAVAALSIGLRHRAPETVAAP